MRGSTFALWLLFAVAAHAEPAGAPSSKEPEWTFVKAPAYMAYELIKADGGRIPGQEFEDQLMCKNIYETFAYFKWALSNLTLVETHPDYVGFEAYANGHVVEVALVNDQQRRIPMFLYVAGKPVAHCEHSFAYP
jgi:hypothetical protein